MGLIVKDPGGGGDFEPMPAGPTQLVCISIWDTGTRINNFGNEIEEIIIGFEAPEHRLQFEKDGEQVNMPMVISKPYRASLHVKANLRNDLEDWRGKGFTEEELQSFHVAVLLGVNGWGNIVHRKSGDRTFANIKSISKLHKQFKVVEPEHEPCIYAINEPNMATFPKKAAPYLHWGEDIPDYCPDWIRKNIMSSNEYQALYGGATPEQQQYADSGPPGPEPPLSDEPPFPDQDDDIPF